MEASSLQSHRSHLDIARAPADNKRHRDLLARPLRREVEKPPVRSWKQLESEDFLGFFSGFQQILDQNHVPNADFKLFHATSRLERS